MKITVKRKTGFLGMVVPINLYFNDEYIGKISDFEEREIEILGTEGILKYKKFLEKGNEIGVENEDYIIMKDTLTNKVSNIIFLSWFIMLMANIFFFENDNLIEKFGLIFLAGFIIILISMIFQSSHKFIKVKE